MDCQLNLRTEQQTKEQRHGANNESRLAQKDAVRVLMLERKGSFEGGRDSRVKRIDQTDRF